MEVIPGGMRVLLHARRGSRAGKHRVGRTIGPVAAIRRPSCLVFPAGRCCAGVETRYWRRKRGSTYPGDAQGNELARWLPPDRWWGGNYVRRIRGAQIRRVGRDAAALQSVAGSDEGGVQGV